MTNPIFTFRNNTILALALATAIIAAGCGGTTPAGPSASPSAVAGASGFALESGDETSLGTLAKGGTPGKPAPAPPVADDDDDKDARRSGDVKGVIALAPAVSGLCPAKTFTVGTQTVVTTVATTYKHGGCADLVAGARVSVDGVTQPDGKVAATHVKFHVEDEDDADDDEDEEDSDKNHRHPHVGPFDGTVSRFTGVCPTVTFNLQGMTIQTTATTTFVGGTCAMLRPNVQVTVEGTVPATGGRTVTATSVTITRRR